LNFSLSFEQVIAAHSKYSIFQVNTPGDRYHFEKSSFDGNSSTKDGDNVIHTKASPKVSKVWLHASSPQNATF
jgi:hypothetical protein